ncbi:MAG: bacillithiol biosynthesis cysteine-adding enzyme BshC [Vicinamibacterales bacterium]
MSAEPITDGPRAPLLAEGDTRAGVDVRRFPWIRPLSGAYAYDFPSVAALYAGDPQRPEAWREVIDRVHQHRQHPNEMARVLTAQQERRQAPPEARAAAARLSDPATVAIVTGQQAGAFGGPMYTILKAVTAIQLARRVAEEQRATVVPIFWVDAEDHDWTEIASCTVLDSDFQARTVTLDPPDGAGQRPVAALTLDDRIARAIDELATLLPATPFTQSVIDSLRAAYRPGVGVAEAFARWIEGALGRFGLVVFESSDAAAKPLAAQVFARELRTAGTTASLAAKAGESMTALGHAPQVEPQLDQPAVFRIDGTRTAIRRDGGTFTIGDETVAAAALIEQAEQSPARFSPNVLLRPIVQDTLFPTIGYVAGPSEMAYLGQLREVYAAFDIPMPLIVPRASATLVDSAAARFLRRYPVDLASLQPQDEAALNQLLKSQLPASVEHAMREAGEAVRASLTRVAEALPDLDPTLAGAARTTLGKMEHDLQSLHSKIIQAAKRRDDTLRRQFTRVQAQAFPQGHPQERTLAVVHFLNQYGPSLFDRLIEELPIDPGQHWVLTV